MIELRTPILVFKKEYGKDYVTATVNVALFANIENSELVYYGLNGERYTNDSAWANKIATVEEIEKLESFIELNKEAKRDTEIYIYELYWLGIIGIDIIEKLEQLTFYDV